MSYLERILREGSENEIWQEWNKRSQHARLLRYWLSLISERSALALLEKGSPAVAAMLSYHPNGYVRQAALEAMPPEGAAAALIVAIECSNDWVPVIREIARKRAMELVATASPEVLEEALVFVYRLSRQQRGDSNTMVGAFFERYGLRIDPFARRRSTLSSAISRWLVQRNGIRTVHDVRAGLSHPDPVVRSWAARAAKDFPETLPEVHAARSARVRRIGLPFAPVAILGEALSDPDAGVRNDARYLLGKADFAAWYREHLPKPGAVSGLGETGRPEDADLLRPLLDHPSADVRRRALEAMVRLVETQAAPDVRRMLRDPSQKVKRAAATLLARLPVSIEPEEIDLLRSAASAWPLADRLGRWPSVIYVVQHASTFPLADLWLRRWTARGELGLLPPKLEEVATLRRSIESAGALIADQARTEVLDIVRIWDRNQ